MSAAACLNNIAAFSAEPAVIHVLSNNSSWQDMRRACGRSSRTGFRRAAAARAAMIACGHASSPFADSGIRPPITGSPRSGQRPALLPAAAFGANSFGADALSGRARGPETRPCVVLDADAPGGLPAGGGCSRLLRCRRWRARLAQKSPGLGCGQRGQHCKSHGHYTAISAVTVQVPALASCSSRTLSSTVPGRGRAQPHILRKSVFANGGKQF